MKKKTTQKLLFMTTQKEKEREVKSYGYNERHYYKSFTDDFGSNRTYLYRDIFTDSFKKILCPMYRNGNHKRRS